MKTKLMKVGKNENAEITVRDAGGKFGVYLEWVCQALSATGEPCDTSATCHCGVGGKWFCLVHNGKICGNPEY